MKAEMGAVYFSIETGLGHAVAWRCREVAQPNVPAAP
jgi:hypothetical protein